jgi:hypothetical protein
MSSVLSEPELNDAGEVDDSRPYYCPECGLRYDTPGACTGRDEGGHAPIAVEKVKATKTDDGDGEAKPKPAAKRKRKTASASK